jgi:hypothetical protein
MLSRQEEKELLGLGEELLLTDFPNPERLGCAGTEALRTLALRSQSLAVAERNRLLDHMPCCSPCFSEFSAFVDQARRRKRLAVIGLCAILLVTIGFRTTRDILRALEETDFKGIIDVELYGMPTEAIDESYRQAREILDRQVAALNS